MLIHASTAVWGTWHVDQFLGANLPSLLAPGNLPALAAAHRVTLELATRPSDWARIARSPLLARLRSLVDVKPRPLARLHTGNPIEAHHVVWKGAVRQARRKRALALFLPPDVVWADGSLASLSRRIDEGKRALFNTYLRVVSDHIGCELEPHRRERSGSLNVPPRALVAAGFRHLHPLMACHLVESDHFPQHAEMLVFGVRGEGLLVRLLARELFCFDPGRFELTDQCLLATLPDPAELHLFDDSDELCALSLAPLFKDVEWYSAPRTLDLVAAALWWLVYDSPANSWLWRRPVRYSSGERSEAAWASADRSSHALLQRVERKRELFRLHRALRLIGLDAFARALGEATLHGNLAAHWSASGPATLLAPTDRALASSELEAASPERLAEFVLAHRSPVHLDLPPPWRPRTRTRPFATGAEPPRVAGATLAGHGLALGELEIYPIDRALAGV